MLLYPSCSETISELHFKSKDEFREIARAFLAQTHLNLFIDVFSKFTFITGNTLHVSDTVPEYADRMLGTLALIIPIEPEWLCLEGEQNEKGILFETDGISITTSLLENEFTINLAGFVAATSQTSQTFRLSIDKNRKTSILHLMALPKEISNKRDDFLQFVWDDKPMQADGDYWISIKREIAYFHEIDLMKTVVSFTKNYRYHAGGTLPFFSSWLARHGSLDLITDPFVLLNLHISTNEEFIGFLTKLQAAGMFLVVNVQDVSLHEHPARIETDIVFSDADYKTNKDGLATVLHAALDRDKTLYANTPTSLYPTKDVGITIHVIEQNLSVSNETYETEFPVIQCGAKFKFPLGIYVHADFYAHRTTFKKLIDMLKPICTAYRFNDFQERV